MINEAQDGQISAQLYKRLGMAQKFDSLLSGVLDVMNLPDPNNKVLLSKELATGLELFKVSCPVGVLLIIFEARPEVVVQISCLAIKSGNAVILKGGKEAAYSNLILYEIIQNAISKVNHDLVDCIKLVTQRSDISDLLQFDKYIDLVIPRGSNALVKYVQKNTNIPVLGHADGICSVYVDKDADLQKSVRVITDGKINYPAACNATETILIHSDIIEKFLPVINDSLNAHRVRVKADSRAYKVIGGSDNVESSIEDDFSTEFLELCLAVKVVDSLKEAVDHINSHGSHHTDCILTENEITAEKFMGQIDSAGVFVNASTRFADGFRYGFGAEIGVSTCKTHARGPVGLDGLMIYKYRLYGNGHIVGEFGKEKMFTHKDLGIEYGQKVISKTSF